MAAVQKARKVQKKVVKGVHGTRVKKVTTCMTINVWDLVRILLAGQDQC